MLRADATRYHSIYGSYGISVFATRGATLDEMAQQVPLVRFARLTLITVAAVRGAGLRLEPTGRNRATTPWASMTWTRASQPWPGAGTRSSPTAFTTRNLDARRRCDGPGDRPGSRPQRRRRRGARLVLSEARDPSRVRRGAMLVAGNDQAEAVVRIVAVDEDGQVHFTVLPGSLEKNRHLVGRALA